MAGINKRPDYYLNDEESELFEKTPKWVLYTIMRDYALQLIGEVDYKGFIEETNKRKEILKENGML